MLCGLQYSLSSAKKQTNTTTHKQKQLQPPPKKIQQKQTETKNICDFESECVGLLDQPIPAVGEQLFGAACNGRIKMAVTECRAADDQPLGYFVLFVVVFFPGPVGDRETFFWKSHVHPDSDNNGHYHSDGLIHHD